MLRLGSPLGSLRLLLLSPRCACRPPLRTTAAQCALPLPGRWGGGGEGEEEEDCKGRMQVYIQDEKVR
ncbi:hypothetical protein NQZ68_012489 [Dissostichus eleginoides]|nr:hypothetical protein NQZ68_012489 [Dissostichus eleginoides]